MKLRDLEHGISVILCCHNSEAVLVPSIRALSSQVLPDLTPCEVILVDNNCIDRTVELAMANWESKLIELRVVKEKTPGLVFARMRGVREVKHDITIFIDDDNILMPDYLARVYRLFETMPGVGLIGGFNKPLTKGAFPWWFRDFMAVYACGPQAKSSGYVTRTRKHLFGAGLSIRTEILRKIFFSEAQSYLVGRTDWRLLRGEDSEICMKCILMGEELWYDESLCLEHYIQRKRLTWSYVCKARTGDGRASVILDIYKRLIDNSQKSNCLLLLLDILLRWLSFIKRGGILRINRQGSFDAANLNKLKGFTYEGLRFLGRYRKISNEIYRVFGPGSHSR
jgi:glycosyltransferase involved in cell wall biosynthesis